MTGLWPPLVVNNDNSVAASLFGMSVVLLVVSAIAVWHAKFLFWSTHGWSHRLAGGALLLWLGVGVLHTLHSFVVVGGNQLDHQRHSLMCLFYDTILGILGTTTTLTAARDFPHKHVQNAKGQSGSLSQKALVTQAEMVEHSFYQVLNLLQAWYLHFLSSSSALASWQRWMALWLVSSPWYIRKYFPVHSFSHNWKITPQHQRTSQEVLLYRIKKAQYLFYKHVLLHGLNISIALQQKQQPFSFGNDNDTMPLPTLTTTPSWRVYWLALNTSYVMEFFLQTLVRRNVIHISNMFRLQRWLMATSIIAALWILVQGYMIEPTDGTGTNAAVVVVQPMVCLVSLGLNFWHRHHDVVNVLLTAGVFLYWQQQQELY